MLTRIEEVPQIGTLKFVCDLFIRHKCEESFKISITLSFLYVMYADSITERFSLESRFVHLVELLIIKPYI